MRLPALYVADAPGKGRGVFTHEEIPAETIIEVAPVLVMTAAERQLLDQTLLHDYIFEWGEDGTGCAMALGWIALYNHAAEANCEYFMDFAAATMFVKTVRPIAAGEELFVNYNGNFNNATPVWFEQ